LAFTFSKIYLRIFYLSRSNTCSQNAGRLSKLSHGRQASLQSLLLIDEEGQVLGRSSGYKAAQLAALEEGAQLPLGQREVEISGIIAATDFEHRLGQGRSREPAAVQLPRKAAAKRKRDENLEEEEEEAGARSLVLELLKATTAKFKPFKMPSRVGADIDAILAPRTVAPGEFS
jgi:hypothetical protein